MRKSTLFLLILAVGAFGASLMAHEGKPHVMGTISAVDAHHIEIKATDGDVVSAKLDDHTKYFKGKGPATAADLKVGLRVIVHLTGEGKDATATEVHLPADKPDEKSGHSHR